METTSKIAEAIRKTSEAYVEALTTVGRVLADLRKLGNDEERMRLFEQWLRFARMSKDGVVTALDQGFELWERECRRMIAADKSGIGKEAPANPMEAWTENWKRAAETFQSALKLDDRLSEQVRKQAEMVQKTLQDGFKVWQRLWSPGKGS